MVYNIKNSYISSVKHSSLIDRGANGGIIDLNVCPFTEST